MPEITFWSLERINHSLVGRLMLPGGLLGLMALCVFGFGFHNFFPLTERFFPRFSRIMFRVFLHSPLPCCLPVNLIFP